MNMLPAGTRRTPEAQNVMMNGYARRLHRRCPLMIGFRHVPLAARQSLHQPRINTEGGEWRCLGKRKIYSV
jgi:hypothetical protein